MGDRTTVEITVLASQAEQTFELLKEFNHYNSCEYSDIENDEENSFSYTDDESKAELVIFIINEINYANVDSESELLCNLGISHNVRWGNGCDYGAGRNYFRFNTDGTQRNAIYLPDEDTPTIGIHNVLNKLESEAVEDVKTYLKETAEKFGEPSWLNQAENGALFVKKNQQNITI